MKIAHLKKFQTFTKCFSSNYNCISDFIDTRENPYALDEN